MVAARPVDPVKSTKLEISLILHADNENTAKGTETKQAKESEADQTNPLLKEETMDEASHETNHMQQQQQQPWQPSPANPAEATPVVPRPLTPAPTVTESIPVPPVPETPSPLVSAANPRKRRPSRPYIPAAAPPPPAKKQSKWTPAEDALIIELRGGGMKWEDISRKLPGRSAISCRLHYQNYLERRSEWDEDRKNKLARLYERYVGCFPSDSHSCSRSP